MIKNNYKRKKTVSFFENICEKIKIIDKFNDSLLINMEITSTYLYVCIQLIKIGKN